MHHNRHLVICLVTCLAAAAPMRAPAATFDGVGIKAGFCRSQMRLEGGSYASSSWRRGLTVGAAARFRLSPRLAVEPGLVYAQRGGTYHDLPSMLWGGLAEVDVFEVERNYLELPVLLRCGLAVIIGGGLEHASGRLRVGLDVSYRHALTGVADDVLAGAFRAEGLDVTLTCWAWSPRGCGAAAPALASAQFPPPGQP